MTIEPLSRYSDLVDSDATMSMMSLIGRKEEMVIVPDGNDRIYIDNE